MRRWRSSRFERLEQRQERGHVLQPVGHPGVGRQAVAAGAAGLLVIGLEALGRVEMGDEAHVGLVDAHAEGDGRDHDHAFLLEEAVLVALARRGVEAGVIGQRDAALAAEPRRHLLDAAARQAIDDAGIARDARPRGRPGAAPWRRPWRARGSGCWAGRSRRRRSRASLELEPLDDVAARRPVGGGGERDARHVGKALVQDRELAVFRAEIVAPLRDAMRLVDGEERELRARARSSRQRGIISRSGAT